MNGSEGGSDFFTAAEPIIRKVIENIESPFVWMPLGLFILCILAYPVTKMKVFPYLSIGFLVLALGADWIGRWQNRKTPPLPVPQTPGYRENVFRYLDGVQAKAAAMQKSGKTDAARTLTEKNLRVADEALSAFPDDAEFYLAMGDTLTGIYQKTENVLPDEQSVVYLNRAGKTYKHALKIDPDNARAYYRMGNVYSDQDSVDEAIKAYDKALELTKGDFPEAEIYKNLVIVKKKKEGLIIH